MNPLISIIIPVYNTANYLEECITSLLQQSYTNCEFIFINDGSTDGSLDILEKYKTIDARIIVIDQENQGVSVARNQGLAIAKGTYIGFVDSDDWIEKDMYATLLKAIENHSCDLVLSNMKSFLNGKEYISTYNFPKNTTLKTDYIQGSILPYLIENDDLYSSCNKLFKASIIKENTIQFPPKIALSEDNVFNLLYFNAIKSMVYVDYTGYNYREVVGSATRNIIQHNYFQNVLRLYHFDYKSIMDLSLSEEEINKIKAAKLIKNVLSLFHIYFNPSNKLNFKERYSFVKMMVYNAEVQKELRHYFKDYYNSSNRYSKFLLSSMKEKSVLNIYIATIYSRLRN